MVFPFAIPTSICRSNVHDLLRLVPLIGIPASLQSEFSLTPAGTKNPGQVRGGRTNQLCSGYGVGYPILLIDEAGKKGQTWIDGFGRTIETEEPDSSGNLNAGTCYTYDLNNNLTSVLATGGSQGRSYTYDALSRLTSKAEPESGTTYYCYSVVSSGSACSGGSPTGTLCSGDLGEVCARTDARGITTYYAYDPVNRLTSRTYSDGTPTAYFLYDLTSAWGVTLPNGLGRLSEKYTGNPFVASIFGYDPVGRIVLNDQCTPLNCGSGAFDLNYTYDLAGDLASATNGMGITFSYSYDTAGRPLAVTSNLVDANHPGNLATIDPNLGYWPNDSVRIMTLGNGLAQASAYNSRLQPCRLNTNSTGTYFAQCTDAVPNGNVQDFNYGFGTSNNGNISSWTATGSQAFNRTYTYDFLNRLTTFSSPNDPSGCTGLSWTVDSLANRTIQTVTGGSCGPFQASVNTTNRFNTSPYQYDAAGNLTNDGAHTYTYDAENRISSVDGGTTATYVYDADGLRVHKQTSGNQDDFIYDINGNVTSEYCSAPGYTGPCVDYVYLQNQMLAKYANGTTYFSFLDHLGSTRLVTTYSQNQSQNQQVYDSLDYLPFGEEIAGDTGSGHKFTGYQRDAETGLDYAHARYYNSRLGRFMSGDPAPGDITDPQTLNRYAFVRNNPVNLVDPSGMDDCDPFDPNCGGCDDLFCFDPFGGGGDGGGGGGDIGPQPPIYIPPGVGTSPNPPDGTLASDDPFGGETNGIPNGLQIPGLGSPGLAGCTYGSGSCGGGIYGFTQGGTTFSSYEDYTNSLLQLLGPDASLAPSATPWVVCNGPCLPYRATQVLSQVGRTPINGKNIALWYGASAVASEIPEAIALANELAAGNPEFALGFIKGLSGSLTPPADPNQYAGWVAGRLFGLYVRGL